MYVSWVLITTMLKQVVKHVQKNPKPPRSPCTGFGAKTPQKRGLKKCHRACEVQPNRFSLNVFDNSQMWRVFYNMFFDPNYTNGFTPWFFEPCLNLAWRNPHRRFCTMLFWSKPSTQWLYILYNLYVLTLENSPKVVHSILVPGGTCPARLSTSSL